jgi:glycosyltransferase involved in cell wall biosynthesis
MNHRPAGIHPDLDVFEDTEEPFILISQYRISGNSSFNARSCDERARFKAAANGFDPMIKLTLLVCTYDNADILEETLRSLAAQSDVPCDWEVVVVANNCTDHTLSVCEKHQAAGQIPRMRIICEPRQGVVFARKTGLRSSRGEWVAFIDDDCRLANDWVARAIGFTEAHPEAGVVGGRNILDWEIEPSGLHVSYGESFAGQDWGDVAKQAFSHNRELPCGAGMLIRRHALLQSGYLESGRLIGRDPIHIGAGEDTEIALFIAKRGWEVWYCPELNLYHFIPRQRMTLHYMCRIHRGFGRAEAYLRCLASEKGFRFSCRVRQLLAALKELVFLLRRFPLGFFWYRNERPTWCIRWYYSVGFIRGAIANLFDGERSIQENNQTTPPLHGIDQEKKAVSRDLPREASGTLVDSNLPPASTKKAA